MIRLDTTNRSLTLFLGGAQVSAPLQIVVSYSDQTTTTYLGASQLANSNGVTAVTICAAPAASTIRDIDMVTVLNTDTGSQVVTIQLLDTATTYKIISATLQVGDKLTYTHGSAWQVVDNSGNLKTGATGGSGATITNDTTTATNVYPLFAGATSGSLTTAYTGNANYLYKPSTGELTSSAMISSNGIQINANAVATSYTIATGNNGLSAGPVSVNTGVTVTISTGSTWTVV